MKKLLIFIATVGAVGVCMASGPRQLSLNLEQGDVYELHTKSNSAVSQNLFGQSIDYTMDMNISLAFRVDSADSGGFDMTVWYVRMGVKTEGMGGTAAQEISSDGEASENPMSAAVKALIGKPFNMRMSRDGKVSQVSGMEEIMDAVMAEMEENNTGLGSEMRDQVRTMIKESYGDKSIEANIGSNMSVFPGEPVSPGDSWTHVSQIPTALFPMNFETVYTFVRETDEGYLIRGESVIDTGKDAEPINMNGLEMKYEMHGTLVSETVIDPCTGWTVSGTGIQEIAGSVSLLDNDKIPGGMTMPMTIKSNSSVQGFVQGDL